MLSLSSTQHNAQVEKRRQLEKRLEKDYVEVEALQQSLIKTQVFTEKVTGMLSSIDQRLVKLENIILPIHKITHKLTKVEDRIENGKLQIESVMELLKVADAERPTIMNGLAEGGKMIDNYLASMKRINEAVQVLQNSKYKSVEDAIHRLKELQTVGVRKLDSLFGTWVITMSQGSSTDDMKDEGVLMDELLKISSWLVKSITEIGSASNFPEIYKMSRESYITGSMNQSYKVSKEQEQMFSGKLTRYERGSTSLLAYYNQLNTVMKNEKEFIEKLFPAPYASFIFTALLSTEIDRFLEVAEAAHARTKKSVSKKEYGDVLMLMDLWDGLTSMIDPAIIEFAGMKGSDIMKFKKSVAVTMAGFFKSFISDFNNDPHKTSALASDGTIHELTSTTLNTLKRLVDYSKTISMIFQQDTTKAFMNILSFSHFVTNIVEALLVDIDIKSRGYKKSNLSTVFLLNNYHYILKNLKNSQLMEVIEVKLIGNLENLVAKQLDAYRASWIASVEFLMDSTNIQEGQIVKTLSSKQREEIKDKFKGFNESFDEFVKSSKNYSIPDLELRAQIVKDLKAVLVPMYNRFLDRYQESDFSKNPDKYIKFKKEDIQAILGHLFEDNNGY